MSSALDVADREGRPAFVRFERRSVEDKAATLANGRWTGKDVDFALITPPYTRDVMPMKVPQWLELLRGQLDNGQIKQQWHDDYLRAYEAFRRGEEIPLTGAPIKGWGVISPAQQETLIKMHILTVEDLAAVNDEGIRRIGMGANELRDKAKAWLAQMNDKGALTVKMADVERQNRDLSGQVQALTLQVGGLLERLSMYEVDRPAQSFDVGQSAPDTGISATDILGTELPPSRRASKQRH